PITLPAERFAQERSRLDRVPLAAPRPQERRVAPELVPQPLAATHALLDPALGDRAGMLAVAVEHVRKRAEIPLAGDPAPEVVVLVRTVLGPVAAGSRDRIRPHDDRAVREGVAEEEPAPERGVVVGKDDRRIAADRLDAGHDERDPRPLLEVGDLPLEPFGK